VNAALTEEILGTYGSKGFSLEEQSDHILVVRFKGTLVAVLLQSTATRETIRRLCNEYLDNLAALAAIKEE